MATSMSTGTCVVSCAAPEIPWRTVLLLRLTCHVGGVWPFTRPFTVNWAAPEPTELIVPSRPSASPFVLLVGCAAMVKGVRSNAAVTAAADVYCAAVGHSPGYALTFRS